MKPFIDKKLKMLAKMRGFELREAKKEDLESMKSIVKNYVRREQPELEEFNPKEYRYVVLTHHTRNHNEKIVGFICYSIKNVSPREKIAREQWGSREWKEEYESLKKWINESKIRLEELGTKESLDGKENDEYQILSMAIPRNEKILTDIQQEEKNAQEKEKLMPMTESPRSHWNNTLTVNWVALEPSNKSQPKEEIPSQKPKSQGLGSILMATAMQDGKRNGCTEVVLVPLEEDREDLVSYYERFGLKEIKDDERMKMEGLEQYIKFPIKIDNTELNQSTFFKKNKKGAEQANLMTQDTSDIQEQLKKHKL